MARYELNEQINLRGEIETMRKLNDSGLVEIENLRKENKELRKQIKDLEETIRKYKSASELFE